MGERGIIFEEWGGKVPVAKISAKSGEGISELLEIILLLAELEGLECDFSQLASGVVIESQLDPRRGQAATLLLRQGTLKKGDWVLAGNSTVKIKILEDFKGQSVEEVFAPSPARVVGFDSAVKVGSEFKTSRSSQRPEEMTVSQREAGGAAKIPAAAEGVEIIPLVLKADFAGSLEALEYQLGKLTPQGGSLITLRSEVGDINENDIKLAAPNKNSLVLGFKVKIEKSAALLAERLGVKVASFDLIYDLEKWLREEVQRIIGKEKVRKVLGTAKILKIFKEEGAKKIVGGQVLAGGIFAARRFTLLRRDFPLGEGKILELQVGKIKVNEVLEGNEFGARVEIGLEIAPGDRFEIFEESFVQRELTT